MGEARGRAFLLGVIRAARNGWLIWGVTLLLFFALEFGYRGLRAIRARVSRAAPAVDSSLHPNAGRVWWPELQRDLNLRRNQFDPYRGYWPAPLSSRYVNIDSLGRRATPQAAFGSNRRLLFLMGGSTLWGYTARDSSAIGAFLAQELAARGIRDVEIVNLAQAAFNSTQEATTLLVELARGHLPALVVFVDGYNDIATTGKYGEPGHTYADEVFQQHLDRGRRGFGGELLGLQRHSALLQRLRVALGLQPPAVDRLAPLAICGPVAGYYRNLALAEEAIGRGFGFPVLHFLQPHHSVSRKRRTVWEATLLDSRLVRPCMQSLDSAMADRRGTGFFSLVEMFDQDSATVFIDGQAHITEAQNQRVAQRIADVIVPLLTSRP